MKKIKEYDPTNQPNKRKNQGKSLQFSPGETELYNFPDEELKAMVIKIHNELGGMDEHPLRTSTNRK